MQTCGVCGGSIKDRNRFQICQATSDCRKEYQRRDGLERIRKRSSHTTLLADIFALVPEMPRDVADELARLFSPADRKQALTYFYKAMEANLMAEQKACTGGVWTLDSAKPSSSEM